jgi:PKHD-type hydroxylase
MLLAISEVLTKDDLTSLTPRLAALTFVDGKATAGAAARKVKHNEQASGPDLAALLAFVGAAIKRHPVLEAAARPAQWGPMLVSRYRSGMAYGRHVDNAYMDQVRSDLSFTLFLTDPETYDGGELALDLPGGTQSIKLPAGSMVLYPSTSIHEVMPVTRGERLAVVGWIESRVRGAEHREILFDLANARSLVAGSNAPSDACLLLQKVEANLLRLLG